MTISERTTHPLPRGGTDDLMPHKKRGLPATQCVLGHAVIAFRRVSGGFSPQRLPTVPVLLRPLAQTILESFLLGEARAIEIVFVLAGAVVLASESIFRAPIRNDSRIVCA